MTGSGTIGNGIGNGKASAIVYARAGASVLAGDIDLAAAEDARRIIEAEGGRCVALEVDVARSADWRLMIDACIDSFGKLDVLHNNVGIRPPADPPNSKRKPGIG